MTIEEEREVEFYAASLNAWLNTRFEFDKSLLTLSAGGIGLLITLLTAVGIKSVESFVLYIFALVAFLVCLLSILWVLKHNSTHIERVFSDAESNNALLHFLDKLALFSFLAGVLFSTSIGISIAAKSLTQAEAHMPENKASSKQLAFDSVNGIANMKPVQGETKSFNGINQLKPTTQAAPVQPAQQSVATQVSALPPAAKDDK